MKQRRAGRGRLVVVASTVLVVLALSVLACELMARRLLADSRAQVYRFSAERIYEPVPSSRRVFKRRREGGEALSIPLRFNRLGLRGAEPEPTAGRARVVVFGDSYVEGRYVLEEESFVVRLEHALEELGRSAQVWNAGVGGYGPDQSFLRLSAELPSLEADLAIFVVFAGNDFGDLLRNKLFRLGPSGLERVHPECSLEVQRAFAPPAGSALLQLLRHRRRPSQALEAVEPVSPARLERVLEGALRASEQEYAQLERGDWIVRQPFHDLYDADLSLEPGRASARTKVRLMEGLLGLVASRARELAVPLLFVFVPHMVDACPGAAVVDPERWPDYEPAAKNELLVELAERAGAPALDLLPPFLAACSEGIYFTKVDDHWNARGQALAGELCARAVLELGLLEE